ncbi:hypothetical protein TUM4644_21900 [Shewanella colwelliana]|uniref:Uncharacterized protein n=1 Tax=Shewanella colwelliana TaxID=23 RepID=A0ABQ4NW79_SHECO|nr:hypothetical protein TUM4644_21900 [Shewanella colwelliana]GIU37673.1 hypothetical protein TUM3794_08840 [Shewanella colwelliana]
MLTILNNDELDSSFCLQSFEFSLHAQTLNAINRTFIKRRNRSTDCIGDSKKVNNQRSIR